MITAITQSIALLLSAVAGGAVGVWFSRRRWWWLGFWLPLIPILMIGATRRWYPLGLRMPFHLLVAGRTEFALIAPLSALLMMTPIAKLPQARLRLLCAAFVVVFIVQSSVMPFLMPAIEAPALSRLHETVRSDGVCRQTTDYTCGPAAAVTALHALGIQTDEGTIAVLAHTSRSTGTEPELLAAAINQQFADQHIRCNYRAFASAADLPTDRPTIALIQYRFLVGHYVTVLKVSKNHLLTIGDPLTGLTLESAADFERDWRRVGIVVSR